MKTVSLLSLLALSSALLVFPATGRGAAAVLARVEAVDRVDRLGLPIYAHLQDAQGKAYALVVAPEEELEQAGWPFTVLARDPDAASLALAIERLPGAKAKARARINVLYDDGRRLIITPGPKQATELIGMGMAVIRINRPMAWPAVPEGRAFLQAAGAITTNATISNLMYQVSRDTLSNCTAELSGEVPATIGGEAYTILTRGTSSGEPIMKANQYVYDQMVAAGLEVSYQAWSSNSYSGTNIIGIKRGTTRPNEVILVTAHIDSMPDDDTRSPGADDNGSGCVAVMAAANAFKGISTDRTIRFICFGGEEQGLLGSDAYAEAIQAAGETSVTVFNMDMIAYSTIAARELFIHTRLDTAPGYAQDVAIATTFRNVVSAYGLAGRLSAVITNSGEEASDHYSFWNRGYPGVAAIESDNNFNTNYHTAQDNIAGMNMEYFTDIVRASVGTVAHLAGVPTPPAAPIGLMASDGAYADKVRLTWSAVPNAASYEIWRAASNSFSISGSASLLGTATGPAYQDTNVIPEVAYFYWLKSKNDSGTSAFSQADSGYSSAATVIEPEVTVNGAWGSATLHTGDELSLHIFLMTSSAVNADWWLLVMIPGGGWYYYDAYAGWLPVTGSEFPVSYQGGLFDFSNPVEVLNMSTASLPAGTYTFYFGVDTNMNGLLDMPPVLVYDSATLNLTE